WAGTGDSAGESGGGRVSTWVEDVALAAQELKDSAEVERVSVVGMRLGAALAARAVAGGVAALDRHELDRLLHAGGASAVELGGYPFTREMRSDLEALDVAAQVPKAAKRV